MTTVVPFKKPDDKPDEKERVLSGSARCTCCQHQWNAEAPVGVDWLECEACHLMKGRFVHPAIPMTDRWVCACGCDAFAITRTKGAEVFCINCGLRQGF